MNPYISWLEKQVEEAEKELAVWKEALRLARRKEESASSAIKNIPRFQGRRGLGVPRQRQKPTLLNLAEEILEEYGPLSSKELFNLLEQRGKKTTLNSLVVSLNRERPLRFERDEEGKWYLTVGHESDPEESESTSEEE